jgi:hypothetical protein
MPSNRGASEGRSYTALVQAFNEDDSAESDYDDENDAQYDRPKSLVLPQRHANPLGSHPTSPPRNSYAVMTRLNQGRETRASLSDLSGNLRKVSNSRDITDRRSEVQSSWQRQRDSSIQLDDGFFSKPYGQLRSGTPPITVGSDRKASSGVDYGYAAGVSGRRNVSGKVAEEGRGFR